jgi:hypothetical protein
MDPLTLRLLKTFGPYVLVAVIAASAGFSAAWYIQGLRLTEEKQRYKDREQAIIDQKQIEKYRTDKINEETSNDWIKNLDALHQCYKSGRCGVRPSAGGMPSGGISAPAKPSDAAGTNAVPAADRVAADCADTTLNLNMLQGWNEKVSK